MTTFLAVDLGAKRSGLAWCTEAGLVETLVTIDAGALEARLRQLVIDLEFDLLVFGLPLRRGKVGEAARKVRRVAYALASAIDKPLVFVDEAESTDEARQRFPKVDKDAAAAALILLRFLADGSWEPPAGPKE
jgi:putative transcription antitermination factor YqgF